MLTAPMQARGVEIADASTDDGLVGAPPEPEPPQPGCAPESECVPEESVRLVFAPPFDHCPPTLGKSPVRFFSARTTREQRKLEEHACCYVRFDCSRPAPTRK